MRTAIATPKEQEPMRNMLSGKTPTPRIAVIAVHGVADQQPEKSAQQAADLLLRIKEDGGYQPFRQSPVRIEVQPAQRAEVTPSEVKPRGWRGLLSVEQRPQLVREIHEKEKKELPTDVEHWFMNEQLAEYEPRRSDLIYETVRLGSIRTNAAQTPIAEVHVFEMYWGDLSRLADSAFSFLVEFYQLLFFVCGLGRKTLDFARAEHPNSRLWQGFSWTQATAERLLVLGVPVMNLYLLGVFSTVLLLCVPDGYTRWAFAGFVAAAGAVIGGIAAYRWRGRSNAEGWGWWLFAPVLLAGVLGAAAWFWSDEEIARRGLLFCWWLFAVSGTILWLMAVYQRRRPGAFLAGLIVLGIASAAYLVEMFWAGPGSKQLLDGTVRSAEWLILVLSLCWWLTVLSALVASVIGAIAVWKTKTAPSGSREARAAWTANLAITLAAAVVMIVNMTLWQALVTAVVPKTPTQEMEKAATAERPSEWQQLWVAPHQPIWIYQRLLPANLSAGQAVQKLIDASAASFLGLCAFVLLAALFTAWLLLPAVVAELRTPKPDGDASKWLGKNCFPQDAPSRRVHPVVCRDWGSRQYCDVYQRQLAARTARAVQQMGAGSRRCYRRSDGNVQVAPLPLACTGAAQRS